MRCLLRSVGVPGHVVAWPTTWWQALLLLGLLSCGQNVVAQPAVEPPVGRFLSDSLDIGRPVDYVLYFRHNAQQEVFFPDTARAFRPFVVLGMRVFPTRTDRRGSLDSAVYRLVSFETTTAQPLSVPITLVSLRDCTRVATQPDTIWLRARVVSSRPDTLRLVSDPTVVPLPQQFNYPYLVLALLVAVIAASVIYALFGRSLRRQWQLYQLYQRYLRFLTDYNRLIRSLQPNVAAELAGRALVRWKLYLERLEARPFSTMTTRELTEHIADDRLLGALHEVDQIIYGGTFSEQLRPALRVLRDIATQAYTRHRDALRQAASTDQPVDVT